VKTKFLHACDPLDVTRTADLNEAGDEAGEQEPDQEFFDFTEEDDDEVPAFTEVSETYDALRYLPLFSCFIFVTTIVSVFTNAFSLMYLHFFWQLPVLSKLCFKKVPTGSGFS
jgi:hypothetical protein